MNGFFSFILLCTPRATKRVAMWRDGKKTNSMWTFWKWFANLRNSEQNFFFSSAEVKATTDCKVSLFFLLFLSLCVCLSASHKSQHQSRAQKRRLRIVNEWKEKKIVAISLKISAHYLFLTGKYCHLIQMAMLTWSQWKINTIEINEQLGA